MLLRTSLRLASQAPSRAFKFSSVRIARPARTPQLATFAYARPFSVSRQFRHDIPQEVKESKVYNFEEVDALSRSTKPQALLIDVREPSEYLAGHIPGALNIPIGSQPEALALSPSEFEETFGFPKPAHDTELVFYCKAGVRSSAAAGLARGWGYKKLGEYRGSWNDWVEKGGRTN